MRWCAVALVSLSLVGVRSAYADTVDVQARQLKGGGDYKLRLSAAVALAKTRDPRAIDALVHALENDSGSTIRRVAARSLGVVLDAAPEPLRKRGTRALERAAERDSSTKVRRDAKNALAQLGAPRDGPGVFINIGKSFDKTRRGPSGILGDMSEAVERTLRAKAPTFSLRWPDGGLPTRADLARTSTRAYFVGATVTALDVERNGKTVEVRCSVQMRVNPWQGTDSKERWQAQQVASATGNGKLTGSSTRGGIRDAKRDCVVAVVEQVTTKQVVPFLNRLIADRDPPKPPRSRSRRSKRQRVGSRADAGAK